LRQLLGATLYAFWWWFVIASFFLLGWIAVMTLPRHDRRWAVLRRVARAALVAAGVPASVNGLDRIPRSNAMLVFNHSSYMDVIVLAAVLPGEPAFVAKKELASQFFAGPFLRRLGTPFVERYDVASSLADAETLITLARQGRILVFFPEGTFTRRTGLSGFYLGAFKVAAEANLPVIPGILRGTRSMLRGEQWFPRRAAVSVEVTEPVMPKGTEFTSVLWLRDAVRNVILARCGEPDLGELIKPEPATLRTDS
jgi:1-acyl-sn-glycerol-3-phosphate acyltransferase